MTHNSRASRSWWIGGGLIAAIGIGLAGALPRATAAVGPSLGAARSFVVLGGSSISNTGSTSSFDGDVGVSPGSSVSGFSASQVSGGIYVGGQPEADAAHSDAALAYAFLEGMVSTTNLTGTDLGGLTLTPGVYKFNSSAQLTGQLFLDAGGDSGAVFVFQIASTLTTGSGSQVTVINGGADYDESKTYWQVGSSATLGSGTAFTGNILAYASISLVSGSTMKGNALALGGSVTTDSSTMVSPPVAPLLTAAPTNLTAVLAGSPVVPGADLAWNDASDNETEFRVFRREGAGPVFTQIAVVASTTTAATGGVVTYRDPVLDRMKVYTYRVTAYGAAAGESVPSNEALVDTAVFVPINLAAVLTGSPVVPDADLSWNDASDNETEFRVFRRTGAETAFVQIATVPSMDGAGTGALVTYRDVGLDRMKIYSYRVTAFGSAVGESTPSNVAMVDTGIFVPIALTAALSGSTETPGTDLRWTDVSDNETAFRVYRKEGAEGVFVLIATVPSTDTPGTGTVVTYNDPILEYLTTFTYRVTAVGASGGESVPSNEATIGTTFGPPVRWVSIHLGRGRNYIRDRARDGKDEVRIKGTYTVLTVDSEVPTVQYEGDPRTTGLSIQVRSPGNLALITIPANDPNWKVSKRGVYRWRSHDGRGSPVSRIRIDVRKSEFKLRSMGHEFTAAPTRDVLVSFSTQGAVGSEMRQWELLDRPNSETRSLFVILR